MDVAYPDDMRRILPVLLLTVTMLVLASSMVRAQTIPDCSSAANAGSSYETCTSGVCEKFVCNGSSFSASESWNTNGTMNIDFGNDTSTCNAARSGRLRYTGGAAWSFCNGTSWSNLISVTLPINADNATNPSGRIISIGTIERNFLSNAGTDNVFLGDSAGNVNLGGSDNVFIGYQAGLVNTLGSNNIFVGSGAGSLNVAGSDNILIGKGVAALLALTSNYINIGNVIYGNMEVSGTNSGTSDNSASLAIDGSLKLGTSSELCLPGNGGRMRYNSTTRKMQYCNELAWTDM